MNINGRPALRVDDTGIHAACCGPNTWQAAQGSATVLINGKPAVRMNDMTRHCGGTGRMVEGSANVIIGGASSSAAGGSGSGAGGTGNAAPPGGPVNRAAPDASGTNISAARPTETRAAARGSTMSSASPPAAKPQPTDKTEQVTFQVLDPADGHPVGAGVSILVEFPDGQRQSVDTNRKGEVTIRHVKGATFKLVEVAASRHLHTADTKEG